MKWLPLTILVIGTTVGHAQRAPSFQVHEATIADIQRAIQGGRVTTRGVVQQYLNRIKAYNGTCVNEPQGLLGPVTTIPHARQINALWTNMSGCSKRLRSWPKRWALPGTYKQSLVD